MQSISFFTYRASCFKKTTSFNGTLGIRQNFQLSIFEVPVKMDDGELDLSSQLLLPDPEMSNALEEFMKNTQTSCTHTHTCNPPGPTATSHTHTCHHTHTQVFASIDETDLADEPNSSPKNTRQPLGNREAVHKYQEKKKAHTAFLEEEVEKLRLMSIVKYIR